MMRTCPPESGTGAATKPVNSRLQLSSTKATAPRRARRQRSRGRRGTRSRAGSFWRRIQPCRCSRASTRSSDARPAYVRFDDSLLGYRGDCEIAGSEVGIACRGSVELPDAGNLGQHPSLERLPVSSLRRQPRSDSPLRELCATCGDNLPRVSDRSTGFESAIVRERRLYP